MGIPWRKIFNGAKAIVPVVFPEIEPYVELVETAFPLAKGPDKLAAAQAISRETVDTLVAQGVLTAAQGSQFLALEADVAGDFVRYKNRRAQLDALVASFKLTALQPIP